MNSSKILKYLGGAIISLAFFLLPLLSAQALNYNELQYWSQLDNPPKVLGETIYPALTLVNNRSLKFSVTPLAFQDGKWNYRLDWRRTLNQQGSIVLRKGTVWYNQQPLVDTADQSGSIQTGFILTPSVRYNLEFYVKPGAKSVLLARKYFTVMKAPTAAFCDYPAPPANCHYEGMDSVTGCGGVLVSNSGGVCQPDREVKACTQEIKLCSDGKTYVSRQWPACEFAACPVPVPSTQGFVMVNGTKLYLNGQPFYIKGINYWTGSYYNFIKDSSGTELVNPEQLYHDFDAAKTEADFIRLKNLFGINTLRIFLRSKADFEAYVKWHNWDPWYLADGSINPIYLSRIKDLLAAAGRQNLKVEIVFSQNEDSQRITAPVGSSNEQFYLHYIRSVVPALKDDPTILAYEWGAEGLDTSENFWQKTGYEARVLSFAKRMIAEIRRLDPNHLITAAEIASSPATSNAWHYPTPELAMIDDVDNLNNGRPYNEYSLVDYISPHFYQSSAADIPLVAKDIAAAVAKQPVQKPVVSDEFGYTHQPATNYYKDHIALPQAKYFSEMVKAEQAYGWSGMIPWSAWPVFPPIPGKSSVAADANGNMLITFNGPPKRILAGYNSTMELADWDDSLLPAGKIFRDQASAISNFPANSAVLSLAQPPPATVATGQTFTITISAVNNGDRIWRTYNPAKYNNADLDYALIIDRWPNSDFSGDTNTRLPVDSVPSGGSTTFTLNLIAPKTPGAYSLNFQMLQNGIGKFGNSVSKVITVY